MTPSEYRDGAEGQTIRFAHAPCALGTVLVAATDRGVCAIEIGDDAETLTRRLREQLPEADLRPADESIREWVTELVAHIETPSQGLSLPLDVQGTAFQLRVWEALQAVPAGETTTYSELAGAIGRPGCARAVGAACAANRLALAIPCHRAVRADGGLAGYRWGVERKRALLRRESREKPGKPDA